MFLIKSMYFRTRKSLGKDCYSCENKSPMLKAIWQAKVIPKVSMFAWRLVHNVIPLIANLRGKDLQVKDICCVCGERGESTVHVMVNCKLSQEVWANVYPSINEMIRSQSDKIIFSIRFSNI